MKMFFTNKLSKALGVLVLIMVQIGQISAQVSPYALTPDWYVGNGARLTFANGNFPTSASPAAGAAVAASAGLNPEASTSICFRNGNVAVFSNTQKIWNGASATVRTIDDALFGGVDGTCAGSATGGGLLFPDPARNNPLGTNTNDAFYMVLANDLTGGNCPSEGNNQYRFTGTGTGVTYNAGPTLRSPGSFAGEAITAGSDGTGGYWVVVHDKTTSNVFRVWHYLTDGTVVQLPDQTATGVVNDQSSGQSYLKISPCQNKIAYHSGGRIQVYAWDRTNGTIGANLLTVSTVLHGVGLEFSPDGNRIYHCGQNSVVSWSSIPAGTSGTVAGSASWSLQLGPDGKIYCSPAGSNIGVISNPNTSPTYSTISAGGSLFRGLANQAWLNPQRSAITQTGACSVTFGIDFKNYFNTQVAIDVSTIEWDFTADGTWEAAGQATPTFDYSTAGGSGAYTVNVRFKDQVCGQDWTATTTVNAVCALPVEWLEVSAVLANGAVLVDWSTSTEQSSSHFIVERSVDGINFSAIGTVAAAGNSSQIRNYSLNDLSATAGVSYYRIRQVDLDGKNSYSRIMTVNRQEVVLNVFPNPTEDAFEIEVIGAGVAMLQVTDLLGRVVLTHALTGDYANFRLGDSLGKGTYVLTVTGPAGAMHKKIVKE